MPVTPTYPGVYVEEIPSGVRTITGVATSITAFLGRTLRGPINDPVTIHNFGDFERTFGGLWQDSPLSYAVRDFFLNGGSEAIIVRLFNQENSSAAGGGSSGAAVAAPVPATTGAPASSGTGGGTGTALALITNGAEVKSKKVTLGELIFQAANPGAWNNDLRAEVDEKVSTEVADQYELVPADLFNLTVRDAGTGVTEVYRNLSVKNSPRRVDRLLKSASNLVRWAGPNLNETPLPTLPTQPISDTITVKEKELDVARKAWLAAKIAGASETELATAKDTADKADLALKQEKAKDVVTNGQPLKPSHYVGSKNDKTGLYALDKADLFNLLCIPPDTREGTIDPSVYQTALQYCVERRAMLIVDPPAAWSANKDTAAATAKSGLTDLGLAGVAARNAVLYFPRVVEADPKRDGQLDTFAPCGIIAGAMARTDAQRGVWKAPAGIDVALNGIQGLEVNLTDEENGTLNPLGINCLRSFPIIGRVVWGARTLRGADQLADEYKYVPVRRLALYIEESLYRGLKWVVFEPNDEPLWSQIRLNVGAFMHNLFRQGAFQGSSPREAYFVKCDKETTTQNDINLGIVNIVVGFAPLKPAEFVIIKLQQMAGQIEA